MNMASEKIILIDDEQRMCESLSELLTKDGYNVAAFQQAHDAVDVIRGSKVDLVVSYINMQDISGLDILKIVKEVDEDIPVILMTGYASLDSAVEAISNGAYDYLLKPVEYTHLGLAVKRAIEKRRSDLYRLRLLEELKISNLILHRRISELNALYEAGKSIGSTANLKELLRQIVALASNVTEAQVGSIMLLDERGEYMTIEAAIGLEGKVVASTRLPVGESIAGFVAAHGEPLIIEDVEHDTRFKRMNKERYGAASLLCAPLIIKNKVIGVINMANKQDGGIFAKNDLRLLTTFASQAAIAVDDANQFQKNRRRLIEFEILHEITTELTQIQTLHDFRISLVSKLGRLFPIDFSIWFNWDGENKIFVAEGITGMPHIPMTRSGKIDLRQTSWQALAFRLDSHCQQDVNDIPALTNLVIKWLQGNNVFPQPKNANMAIPILKYGELAHIFFLGADTENDYGQEDISLAKLVISQSAVLFEREKSLLNATRLLTMGNMISEISHDLRRPLTTIKGGLQIIKSRSGSELADSDLFVNVEDEVHRMNELVKELVDFSNPKKYQTERVDLRQIINKASELVGPDLRKKNISYWSSFDEADWNVIINKNQVLEVFLNLFINAVDAMSNNGQLTVHGTVERPEHKKIDYLAVKVTDTGEGIRRENLSKIFDRYFTTKSTGTGLGLAVVERIISAHDGTLGVQSEEGKGTTFTVYLPYGAL